MDFKKQFKEGLLTKNPVLVQLLGMCSTLAITTSLFNGIGMGLAVTVILICSNILISALRKVIPNQIRIAAYITIIAGFVTVVDLLHSGVSACTVPEPGRVHPADRRELYRSWPGGGICLQERRSGAPPWTACVRASATPLALVTVCVIRELLGSGTFGGGILNGGEGIRIIPAPYPGHADGHACGRLPDAGLRHRRVPVACKASGK